MVRPLPDDVARPVRAYLATLVAADEVSDAWHEVLADVAYWGDRALLPVLRLAHQVVLQHERVAPPVAALALVEVGVDRPDDVAVVLDTDPDSARLWIEQATASRDGNDGGATGRFADRPQARAAPADPTPSPSSPAPSPPRPAAVRIGFDEETSRPDLGGATRHPRVTVGGLVVVALGLCVAVLVVWAVLR